MRINCWEGRWPLNTYRNRDPSKLSRVMLDRLAEAEAMTLDGYRADLKKRDEARAVYEALKDECDVCISLAAPAAAPVGLNPTGDPSCTVHVSLLGIPAISLPVMQDEGLPLGLQVTGFLHGDAAVFAAAAAIERLIIDVVPACRSSHAAQTGCRTRASMKLAVPDMISNSYFPAIAAVELGFFKEEGLDVDARADLPGRQELHGAARRRGRLRRRLGAFGAGGVSRNGRASSCSARRRRACTGSWSCTTTSAPTRGDIGVVKGSSIGAAPWVEMGLRRLLIEAGIDLARDGVTIAPVPGALGAGVNFGVTAAKALEDRKIDGFWANGMGAEVAVQRGVGTVVLDVRRGDGPKPCFNYTMASIATTDALIAALARDRRRRGARDREDAGRAEGRSVARHGRSGASSFRRRRPS